MTQKQFVGQVVSNYEKYDEVGPITGIALIIDDEQEYRAGSEDGYVLEVECPYGTQDMADQMYQNLKGKVYKSFRAKNASLPVTAELGDAITVNRTYSFLAYQSLNFGPNNRSEIAAPGTSEAEHEYPYITSTQREFDRRIATIRSYIIKENDRIELRINNEIADRITAIELTDGQIRSYIDEQNGEMRSEFTQTIDSFSFEISDRVDGLETNFDIRLGEVSSTLNDSVNELQNTFSQTLSETSSTLTDNINEVRSEISQRVDTISTEITSQLDGLSSSFNQTKESFELRISSTEGATSTLRTDLTGLTNTVSSTNGTVATLKNTVDGFSSTYVAQSDLGTKISNAITNNRNGISLSVDNGKKSSSITLSYGNTEISSETVKFTGTVVFESDLEDGTTTVSGDCITTGEVDADYLNLYGDMSVYEEKNGSRTGWIGYVSGKAYNDNGSIRNTDGIGVKSVGYNKSYDGGMVICTDSGARLTYGPDMFGSTTTIACVSEHCYSSEDMEVFSDRRLKENIEYEIDSMYDGFFRALKPCRFTMKNSRAKSYHIGFIAQEVEDSLSENNLSFFDFYGISKLPDEDGVEGMYSLAYTQFTALNTAMIQRLMTRVDELETELKQLKGE